MTDDELLDAARAAGYELAEVRWNGQPAYRWQGAWPRPFFLDRDQALRWVDDRLSRRLLT